MTKVKICGITNLDDAILAARFGADALGFNFYEKSARYVAPEKARSIIEQLPPKILKVGVFVNEDLKKIAEIAAAAKLDALQLHGEETPEYARQLKAQTNLEIIKAFRVSPEFKPADVLDYETDAILLDAYNPKEHGGTGETFDWEIARKVREVFPKMYLAGGLSRENIKLAIHHVYPFAVDTCSRIEREKGKKDKVNLVNFILSAKNADKMKTFFQSKTAKISNIYELLDAIQCSPALFLGKYSISHLRTYIEGIAMAARILEKSFDFKKFKRLDEKDFNTDNYFTEFVAKYFGQSVGAKDWSNIILEQCNNDEQKALDLFFVLLEEFKIEKESSDEN